MPTRKTTRPSRSTRLIRNVGRRRNVTYLHEHLSAKGWASTPRCRRLRLLVEVADALGPDVGRCDLDMVMRSALRRASFI